MSILYIEGGSELETIMKTLGSLVGDILAFTVNRTSDLLYLISKPLWMRFGLWITSLQEGENNE